VFDLAYAARKEIAMFSTRYEIIREQVSELSGTRAGPLDSLRPLVASDFAPFFWSEGFGLGGELDQAIVARSAEVKHALYGGRVFVIAPIYVTSICQEQCLYCNFRGGNKGIGVERRRLTEDELEREALYQRRGIRRKRLSSPGRCGTVLVGALAEDLRQVSVRHSSSGQNQEGKL